jgi:glycosyltransferase involved in cell wall biosynthesis
VKGIEEHGVTVKRLICGGEEAQPAASFVYKKHALKKYIPAVLWQSLKDFRLMQMDKHHGELLEQLILKEKPDAIYERGFYLMKSGYTIAKKYGIPYYVEVNAPFPEEKVQMDGPSLFISRARKIEGKQLEMANGVFTVSSAMKDYLLRGRPHIHSDTIHVTPNAVNPANIQYTEKDIRTLRARRGLDETDKVIGFVGSIFPYHGVDLLIEAFEALSTEFSEACKLLIVGGGESLPRLKERVQGSVIADKVIFTDNIPHKDVYAHIALMDITVMAKSNWYGSPVKIFEYGALGKAIIAPDVIPVRDVMVHQVHGLLVKDNLQELKRALMYLLTHPEKAREMAEQFKSKVLSEHTWHKTASHILQVMQQ